MLSYRESWFGLELVAISLLMRDLMLGGFTCREGRTCCWTLLFLCRMQARFGLVLLMSRILFQGHSELETDLLYAGSIGARA